VSSKVVPFLATHLFFPSLDDQINFVTTRGDRSRQIGVAPDFQIVRFLSNRPSASIARRRGLEARSCSECYLRRHYGPIQASRSPLFLPLGRPSSHRTDTPSLHQLAMRLPTKLKTATAKTPRPFRGYWMGPTSGWTAKKPQEIFTALTWHRRNHPDRTIFSVVHGRDLANIHHPHHCVRF
jgi:hypothetical protein